MGYEEWEEIYRNNKPEDLPWELGRARPQLVELIKSGKLKAEGKALDLGCGLGANAIYLAQSGFETSAVDISRTAVYTARKRAEREVKIRFAVASALRLPFSDGEFDFVFDMGLFHHIKPGDRVQFLQELLRVLKVNGKYFMTCFSYRNGPAWNHFSIQDLEKIFKPHFSFLESKHIVSVEGDGVARYFYTMLMEKAPPAPKTSQDVMEVVIK